MIILDTNVISALMRSIPDTQVVSWLNRLPPESLWTTSICVFEIVFGIQSLTVGKRRAFLQIAFENLLQEDLEGRVLEFDAPAAHAAASLSAELRAKGRPVEIRDVFIAGIVTARRGTLATRNIKHFLDTKIPLVDPWSDPV
jgi:predicted nucleic acid-binding protein